MKLVQAVLRHEGQRIGNRVALETLGRVNRSTFAVHPPGTLMLVRFEGDFESITLEFERNESRPWTMLPTPEGFREAFGSDGSPAIPSADFGVLDGHTGRLDLAKVGEYERVTTLPWSHVNG